MDGELLDRRLVENDFAQCEVDIRIGVGPGEGVLASIVRQPRPEPLVFVELTQEIDLTAIGIGSIQTIIFSAVLHQDCLAGVDRGKDLGTKRGAGLVVDGDLLPPRRVAEVLRGEIDVRFAAKLEGVDAVAHADDVVGRGPGKNLLFFGGEILEFRRVADGDLTGHAAQLAAVSYRLQGDLTPDDVAHLGGQTAWLLDGPWKQEIDHCRRQRRPHAVEIECPSVDSLLSSRLVVPEGQVLVVRVAALGIVDRFQTGEPSHAVLVSIQGSIGGPIRARNLRPVAIGEIDRPQDIGRVGTAGELVDQTGIDILNFRGPGDGGNSVLRQLCR